MSRLVVLVVAVLLTAGCAPQTGGGGAGASPSSPSSSSGSSLPPSEDDRLVLQVRHTGGFVMPPTTFARLPLVSVYADGRVLTQGPVIAIAPPPALPNLQVARVDPARVPELVERALAAGVGQDVDHGRPALADAPSTLFMVVADGETHVTEVYALTEGLFGDPAAAGLTEEQATGRARLQALLEQLTALGSPDGESYVPEAVAAVVTPYAEADLAMPEQPEVAWPGPPLPGEPLDARLGLSCVTARGEAAQAVLDAAAGANTMTPWTTDDGSRWAVVLRPLLPHESSCADLSRP